MSMKTRVGHVHRHAFMDLNARQKEGLTFSGRRGFMKAGLAGMAGLTVPSLLRWRSGQINAGNSISHRKSVILLWMAGGPSHIDTWDVKPERPYENRGPFGVIQTSVPGIEICEHLPKQAAMMDRFTLIRSVDARGSNHEPNRVFQTGNPKAAPRVNANGDLYPAIGSVISRFRGSNHPGMPAYVAFMKSRSHLAFSGYLGKRYDPFIADRASRLPVYNYVGKDTGRVTGADLFQLPGGLTQSRIYKRQELFKDFDRLRNHLDLHGSMEAMDSFHQQAIEMVAGRRAQEAFDLSAEDERVRARYGSHLWCQQALVARRLVERGVSFVTLDLSYHPASGTWDTHGDNLPPYGGIERGLGPLLPLFDHLLTTLVSDLQERRLLEDVLVVAMGEFGRTPLIGTQGSTDGRNHWPEVMSMCLAGGGLRHGQVIGATEKDGGHIKERPVTPGDFAATVYHHMEVPRDATYLDSSGRPHYIVVDGEPVRELI